MEANSRLKARRLASSRPINFVADLTKHEDISIDRVHVCLRADCHFAGYCKQLTILIFIENNCAILLHV